MANLARARRLLGALIAASAILGSTVSPTLGVGVVGDGTDDKVTGEQCVRHDGGTDQAIDHCNDAGTDSAADDVAGPGRPLVERVLLDERALVATLRP